MNYRPLGIKRNLCASRAWKGKLRDYVTFLSKGCPLLFLELTENSV